MCWVQVLFVAVSSVVLAKDYSRNHFHELSFKDGVPDFLLSLKGLGFFGTILVCRMLSLVLLALILRPYFLALLLIFIAANFVGSMMILGGNPYKSIWTSKKI